MANTVSIKHKPESKRNVLNIPVSPNLRKRIDAVLSGELEGEKLSVYIRGLILNDLAARDKERLKVEYLQQEVAAGSHA